MAIHTTVTSNTAAQQAAAAKATHKQSMSPTTKAPKSIVRQGFDTGHWGNPEKWLAVVSGNLYIWKLFWRAEGAGGVVPPPDRQGTTWKWARERGILTPDGVRIDPGFLEYARANANHANADRALMCDVTGVRHLFALAVIMAGEPVDFIRDAVNERRHPELLIYGSFFERGLARLVDIEAVAVDADGVVTLPPYGRRVAKLVATRPAWRAALLTQHRPWRPS
jgi:hypothetical protein